MERIASLLQTAYGGTKEERSAALVEMAEALTQDPISCLVQLVQLGTDTSGNFSLDVRFMALSHTKNTLINMEEDTENLLNDSNQLAQIQSCLMNSLHQADPRELRMILECIRLMVSMFKWDTCPQLTQDLDLNCNGPETSKRIVANMSALRIMTKMYTMRSTSASEEHVFTICVNLCNLLPRYFATGNFQIAKLSLKIFEACLDVFMYRSKKLPAALIETLKSWFQFIATFVTENTGIFANGSASDRAQYVKCVKRSASLTFSITHHVANKKKPCQLAEMFVNNFGAQFLALWTQWLQFCNDTPNVVEEAYGKKSAMFSMRYIKTSSFIQSLYFPFINENAISIIAEKMFPFLCYGEEDEEAFSEDDVNAYSVYLHDDEVTSEECTPRHSACRAILAIVGPKKAFQGNPAHLAQLLQEIATRIDMNTQESPERVFGFLHLLGILKKELKKIPEVWGGHAERILSTSIVPRLQQSDKAFLQTKSLWVCHRFARVPFQNEENFKNMVGGICQSIGSPDSKVRLSAVYALSLFLVLKRARPYLRDTLVPLVEECIMLSEHVQSHFVSAAMNTLVDQYAPELAAVFHKMINAMVQQYLAVTFEMKQTEDNAVDDLDEATAKIHDMRGINAVTILNAIDALVLSAKENEGVVAQAAPDLVRLLESGLSTHTNMDFVEKELQLFLHTLYCIKGSIPQQLWNLFPPLHTLVMELGFGVDHFGDISAILDNYVSASPDEFIARDDAMKMTFEMCEKMLGGQVVADDDDIIGAPQVLQALYQQAKVSSCRDMFAQRYLPAFLSLSLRSLVNPALSSTPVRMWIITSVMDAFYFDGAATLAALKAAGAFPQFFYGYVDFFKSETPAGKAALKENASKKKKKDTVDVSDVLTIHVRKVNILGISCFLQSFPLSTDQAECQMIYQLVEIALSFMRQNANAYTSRIKRLNEDQDDHSDGGDSAMLDDDEDYDLGGGDGEAAEEQMNWQDEYGGDDEDQALGEEGDDYEGPMDADCEVSFFLDWCRVYSEHETFKMLNLNANELGEMETVTKTYMQKLIEVKQQHQDEINRRTSEGV